MKKRLGGFKNIHVAQKNASGWMAPIPVQGGKSIEAELTYEPVQFYADNAMDYNDFIFTGGEGTLTVSGLTLDEYKLLFGSTVADGSVVVKSNDQAPEVALLFERNKLGTQDKMLYVLYVTKFSPPSISAQTMEGNIEEEVAELSFTVQEMPEGEVYYMLDTAEHTGSKAGEWFTKVQTA